MKKIRAIINEYGLQVIAFIAFLIAVLVAPGCGTMPATPLPVQTVEIAVKGVDVQKVETGQKEKPPDIISKSMSVENPELQLQATKIHNGVAYMALTSAYGWDLEKLWFDLKLLADMDIKRIVIFMSNPGGAAFQGLGIHDELRILKKQGIKVEIEARGLIASSAIPIFLVADVRKASKHCVFMIHAASLFKWGAFSEKLSDLQEQAAMIKLMNERYAEAVAEHSKLTKDEVLELLKKTTWYSAEQAKEFGFVDELQ